MNYLTLIFTLILFLFPTPSYAFLFASIADGHVGITKFTNTINQIKTLNPNFTIFIGDVENDGATTTELDPMINILKNTGLYNSTFLVRGNHDDHLAGSQSLWQTYFSTTNPQSFPAEVSNYYPLNQSQSKLNYSFDYGNTRFIGLDTDTNANPPTESQYVFLESRLADATNLGLKHAFIFTHPPEYCVESTHCGCQTTTGCGPSTRYRDIINKYPIVSATFHGHEHILSWTHINSTRVPGLTHEYEEFFTSSSGEPYSFTPYPARMDHYNYSSSLAAFAVIDVQDDTSFKVSFYQTGTTASIWSQIFTKNGTVNPTITPKVTVTPLKTPTPTITVLIGDANSDNKVDLADFSIWKTEYLANTKSRADFNNSGTVDLADFALWKKSYLAS
jgi:hypothetical protein